VGSPSPSPRRRKNGLLAIDQVVQVLRPSATSCRFSLAGRCVVGTRLGRWRRFGTPSVGALPATWGWLEGVVVLRRTSVGCCSDPGQVWQAGSDILDPWLQFSVVDQSLTGQVLATGFAAGTLAGGWRGISPSPSPSSPVQGRAARPEEALALISFSGRKAPPGQKRPSQLWTRLSPKASTWPRGPLCSDCGRVRFPCSSVWGRISEHRFVFSR